MAGRRIRSTLRLAPSRSIFPPCFNTVEYGNLGTEQSLMCLSTTLPVIPLPPCRLGTLIRFTTITEDREQSPGTIRLVSTFKSAASLTSTVPVATIPFIGSIYPQADRLLPGEIHRLAAVTASQRKVPRLL